MAVSTSQWHDRSHELLGDLQQELAGITEEMGLLSSRSALETIQTNLGGFRYKRFASIEYITSE